MSAGLPLSVRMSRAALFSLLLAATLASGCAGNRQTREDGAVPPASASAYGSAAATEVSAPGDDPNPFGEDPFAEEDNAVDTPDPIEPVNRGVFWFNDKLYTWVFKPTVKVYRFFIHEKIREGVGNVLGNLTEPVYIANGLLQGKLSDAGRETFRFAVNTTLGVGGALDVARDQGGVARKTEDFGQTLGTYGAGHGFYLVLPILGPSSLRDGIGTVTDYAFTPSTYMDLTLAERAGIKGVDYINEFSLDKDTYEAVVKQSLDPYATIKNAYLQRRKALVEK